MDSRKIPKKVDPFQPGAAIERRAPDAGDAVANRYPGQPGAARER